MTIRLTKLARRAGCAAKQPAGYRIDGERALALTTDFRFLAQRLA